MYLAIRERTVNNPKLSEVPSMPDFSTYSDREVLLELVQHRTIAERAANELMRRANEDVPVQTQ